MGEMEGCPRIWRSVCGGQRNCLVWLQAPESGCLLGLTRSLACSLQAVRRTDYGISPPQEKRVGKM